MHKNLPKCLILKIESQIVNYANVQGLACDKFCIFQAQLQSNHLKTLIRLLLQCLVAQLIPSQLAPLGVSIQGLNPLSPIIVTIELQCRMFCQFSFIFIQLSAIVVNWIGLYGTSLNRQSLWHCPHVHTHVHACVLLRCDCIIFHNICLSDAYITDQL